MSKLEGKVGKLIWTVPVLSRQLPTVSQKEKLSSVIVTESLAVTNISVAESAAEARVKVLPL